MSDFQNLGDFEEYQENIPYQELFKRKYKSNIITDKGIVEYRTFKLPSYTYGITQGFLYYIVASNNDFMVHIINLYFNEETRIKIDRVLARTVGGYSIQLYNGILNIEDRESNRSIIINLSTKEIQIFNEHVKINADGEIYYLDSNNILTYRDTKYDMKDFTHNKYQHSLEYVCKYGIIIFSPGEDLLRLFSFDGKIQWKIHYSYSPIIYGKNGLYNMWTFTFYDTGRQVTNKGYTVSSIFITENDLVFSREIDISIWDVNKNEIYRYPPKYSKFAIIDDNGKFIITPQFFGRLPANIVI